MRKGSGHPDSALRAVPRTGAKDEVVVDDVVDAGVVTGVGRVPVAVAADEHPGLELLGQGDGLVQGRGGVARRETN